VIVQIYEVQSPEEASALVRAGVDHVGVLVGPGEFPRELDDDRTREVFTGIPAPAKKVALSLSTDPEAVARIIDATGPDIVHLGTSLDHLGPEELAGLKRRFPEVPLMRTIPVVDASCVEASRRFDGPADFLLLDTQLPGDPVIGATGKVHDWKLSRAIVEAVDIPVILAGGLGPDNVAQAIREVRPAGVDSKTKTDTTDGARKDLDAVARFVAEARR
jgi:phosphoribosylanthranilate isomerase